LPALGLKARRALDRKTFEKSFAKLAPNGRGVLGLRPKNLFFGTFPRALRGRALRVFVCQVYYRIPLTNPEKLLKKFYQNYAAQTRYGAIKNAPLMRRDSRIRGKNNICKRRFQLSLRLLPP